MTQNIFLFYPNIVGYIRIVFTFMSSYYWFTHPLISVFFYVSQMVLDDLDGIAARKFQQTSLFGATLDIIIDRFSFMVLLMGLCALYPNYMVPFQLAAFLNLSATWMNYSAAVANRSSHKLANNHALLRVYYTKLGLWIFSNGSDLFYVAVYLLYFSISPSVTIGSYTIGIWHVLAAVTLPITIILQLINILILKVGCQEIAAIDYTERARQ